MATFVFTALFSVVHTVCTSASLAFPWTGKRTEWYNLTHCHMLKDQTWVNVTLWHVQSNVTVVNVYCTNVEKEIRLGLFPEQDNLRQGDYIHEDLLPAVSETWIWGMLKVNHAAEHSTWSVNCSNMLRVYFLYTMQP